MARTAPRTCAFCAIVAGRAPAFMVLHEPLVMAFLDARPLFPGHVLVVPRDHHATLADLPALMVGPLFDTVRRVAAALPAALGAEGTFVAANNVVSQSVPHLHVHVVPRRRGDGLRGFFWPRQRPYGAEEGHALAARIAASVPSMGPPPARAGGEPS